MGEETKFVAVIRECSEFVELAINVEHHCTGILYTRVHFSGNLSG